MTLLVSPTPTEAAEEVYSGRRTPPPAPHSKEFRSQTVTPRVSVKISGFGPGNNIAIKNKNFQTKPRRI